VSERFDPAAALRAEFVRGFAEPGRPRAATGEAFLAIRAGGAPRAIALAEIAGLFVDRRITPVPTSITGLLGLVGLRGAMVPVYDLRVLLGANPVDEPRWLVTAAVATVAFAFDGFDGHLRLHDGDVGRAVIVLAGIVTELEHRLDRASLREK
jgi:purine-binding chemotaxis protein CheW